MVVEVISKEAIQVKIVDPTGAGDAFFSKLLQFLDSEGNFIESIDFVLSEASRFAAERVTVIGANAKYEKVVVPYGDCNVCGRIIKVKKTSQSYRQKIAINTNHLLDRTLRAP